MTRKLTGHVAQRGDRFLAFIRGARVRVYVGSFASKEAADDATVAALLLDEVTSKAKKGA